MRSPWTAIGIKGYIPLLKESNIRLYCDVYFVQMRTTLNLDDARIARAAELTGLREKTALIHAGLDALIARASAQRLADLGGQFPTTTPGRRRRPRRAGR